MSEQQPTPDLQLSMDRRTVSTWLDDLICFARDDFFEEDAPTAKDYELQRRLVAAWTVCKDIPLESLEGGKNLFEEIALVLRGLLRCLNGDMPLEVTIAAEKHANEILGKLGVADVDKNEPQ